MAAAQQVLDLPELLESILLSLPMRDLLLAQRVSKTFQQVIVSSPHVQRALFFAPGKAADVNLLLAQDMHNYLGNCVANPLLFRHTRPCRWTRDLILRLDAEQLHDSVEVQPSFMRMLLRQPPIPTEIIYWAVGGDHDYQVKFRDGIPSERSLITLDGERLGDLVKRCPLLREYEEPVFLVYRTTLAMAAAAQVLGLPELLEAILVGLPTKDLLFAQKDCSFWKQTIESSKSIRKALFLVPGDVSDVNLDCNLKHNLIRVERRFFALNPLLFDSGKTTQEMLVFRDTIALRGERQGWSCARMLTAQPPRETGGQCYIAYVDGRERSLGCVKTTVVTSCDHTVGDLAKQHREALDAIGERYKRIRPGELVLI
ncbi:hypothetical protein LTR27_007354 [Elasticomyces elasticus]|nr:hypothetical protein LTR27_007354 [Elasticomyces elasticus]